MLKAGYTEQEILDMSLVTKRRLVTLLNAEADAQDQINRRKPRRRN